MTDTTTLDWIGVRLQRMSGFRLLGDGAMDWEMDRESDPDGCDTWSLTLTTWYRGEQPVICGTWRDLIAIAYWLDTARPDDVGDACVALWVVRHLRSLQPEEVWF